MNCADFPPSTAAFVGDAVFTLFVRERLTREHDLKSGKLSALAAQIISAKTQARIADAVFEGLDADERDMLKRCRNAHTASRAKNASTAEYHRATGLEGLIGLLYLQGRVERLNTLLNQFYEIGKEKIYACGEGAGD